MRGAYILRAVNGDPWAKREAWRYQGQFARSAVYKNLWPGFSYGVGAFVVYVIAEKLFFPAESHHESESHHEEHH